MSFFSSLYRTPDNPPGASTIVNAPVVGGAPMSNGFCYGGGCPYSPTGFDSTGLPSDVFTSNGGFADPFSAADGSISDASAIQDPFSLDPLFASGPDTSPVDLGPSSPGPTDLGNPATNDTSGAGIGSNILGAIGSGLGSLVRGLGSGLGFGSTVRPAVRAMPALYSRALAPSMGSRFGGYAGNPTPGRVPSPPFTFGQPRGMIAPIPGTPGRYGNQAYSGYGQPYYPPSCGTGPGFMPPTPMPMYAGPTAYSPGLGIFPGQVYGGY